MFAPTPRNRILMNDSMMNFSQENKEPNESEKRKVASFRSPTNALSPVRAFEAPFRTVQSTIQVDLPYTAQEAKLRPFVGKKYKNLEDYVKIKSTIDTSYTAVREISHLEKDFVNENVSNFSLTFVL